MDPKYPIGPFTYQPRVTTALRRTCIQAIDALPRELTQAVRRLTARQLNRPYRSGGWTGRQVVHHLADSHVNAYIRLKLALTESRPTIKPYDQERWATLTDARTLPVEASLQLLTGLHARWAHLLRAMSPKDFRRTFHHPESGIQPLDRLLQHYAWHGRHHAAHLRLLAAHRR